MKILIDGKYIEIPMADRPSAKVYSTKRQNQKHGAPGARSVIIRSVDWLDELLASCRKAGDGL